jgi:hypothetical protein
MRVNASLLAAALLPAKALCFAGPNAARGKLAAALSVSTAPSSTDKRLMDDLDEVERWHTPVFQNVCDETGVTLSRFMMEMAKANPGLCRKSHYCCMFPAQLQKAQIYNHIERALDSRFCMVHLLANYRAARG